MTDSWGAIKQFANKLHNNVSECELKEVTVGFVKKKTIQFVTTNYTAFWYESDFIRVYFSLLYSLVYKDATKKDRNY